MRQYKLLVNVKNESKGITMIVLVITIIILIILAGVSINTLIGENGIITKAKQAKQNIALAGEAEALQLNQLYYELETGGELTEDEESTKKDEIIALLQKQVEELQNQVKTLTTENEDLKQQIADLTTQIGTLQTEIEALKEQISQKDIEIEDLKAQVSEKEAKIQELQNQLNNINSLLAQTNATAAQILSGYTAYSQGQLVTGNIPTLDGGAFGTWDETAYNTSPVVSSEYNSVVGGLDYRLYGYFPSSIYRVHIANLIPGNIKVGVKIGGVNGIQGTYTSDATATANNLSSGTTAYVNGQKITGNGTDVNNAWSSGHTAGWNEGYNAGVSAGGKVDSLVFQWTSEGNYNSTSKTLTAKGTVKSAGVSSSSFKVYSWDQNYNHYAGTSVGVTFSGNQITVTVGGGNSISGEVNVTVNYSYE